MLQIWELWYCWGQHCACWNSQIYIVLLKCQVFTKDYIRVFITLHDIKNTNQHSAMTSESEFVFQIIPKLRLKAVLTLQEALSFPSSSQTHTWNSLICPSSHSSIHLASVITGISTSCRMLGSSPTPGNRPMQVKRVVTIHQTMVLQRCQFLVLVVKLVLR